MKSRTRLSDFTFTFHFPALEKEMATHSSVLAWRIPGTAEPGGLPSMGSHRVGHDWSDLAAAAAVLLERECTWLVKNKDFETDCLCQNPDSAELQTVWPWASSLTTLGPCFYVSKNGDDDNITCIAELLWRLNQLIYEEWFLNIVSCQPVFNIVCVLVTKLCLTLWDPTN